MLRQLNSLAPMLSTLKFEQQFSMSPGSCSNYWNESAFAFSLRICYKYSGWCVWLMVLCFYAPLLGHLSYYGCSLGYLLILKSLTKVLYIYTADSAPCSSLWEILFMTGYFVKFDLFQCQRIFRHILSVIIGLWKYEFFTHLKIYPNILNFVCTILIVQEVKVELYIF